jgi:uncharacterized peroxidase-related enzyme
MSWIRETHLDDATAELVDAYAKVAARRGKVANIMKVHSIAPRAMLAHRGLYLELMFGDSPLSRAEREMIAVAVSTTNHCHY